MDPRAARSNRLIADNDPDPAGLSRLVFNKSSAPFGQPHNSAGVFFHNEIGEWPIIAQPLPEEAPFHAQRKALLRGQSFDRPVVNIKRLD